VYASVAEVRAEGVPPASATDARLVALIDEATRTIDKVTRQFFEPRRATLRLDGRSTPTIELPVPPIELTRLSVDYEDMQPFPFVGAAPFGFGLDRSVLLVVGAPIGPGYDGARLTLRHGLVFPNGHGNVIAEGRWGYTEDDGTPDGRTPLAVKRACILLVLRGLQPLADDAAFEARSRWRIIEERTRDQSYRLDPNRSSGGLLLAGDPEVDALLTPYVRSSPVGAA
jgi:hypothetical protein